MAADFVKTWVMVLIGLFIWRVVQITLLNRDPNSSTGKAMAFFV